MGSRDDLQKFRTAHVIESITEGYHRSHTYNSGFRRNAFLSGLRYILEVALRLFHQPCSVCTILSNKLFFLFTGGFKILLPFCRSSICTTFISRGFLALLHGRCGYPVVFGPHHSFAFGYKRCFNLREYGKESVVLRYC